MAIEIRQIEPTRGNLLKFIHFPIDQLYRDSPYYVPCLVTDELNTLMPSRNAAFAFCEAAYFLAYRDGKIVGRAAAIINRVANERTGRQEGRFGFIDFVDDPEVSSALIGKVTQWVKSKGMTSLAGPLGFTDMDREGCLIEGFDQLGTQATIYNYPYYPAHFERLGFEKSADWVEFKVFIPNQVPEKMSRIANIVRAKYHLRTVRFTDRKKLVRAYGQPIFQLINEGFDKLYGYTPLTPAQIEQYIKAYLPHLPLDHVSCVVDSNDQLVAFGISIPSLSKALIKCRGRLFPRGWMDLLKAVNGHTSIVDLMLIAVKPELQSKGVNALIFEDLIRTFVERGYEYAETNVELETNANVQKQWQYFKNEQHKRRRAFSKSI